MQNISVLRSRNIVVNEPPEPPALSCLNHYFLSYFSCIYLSPVCLADSEEQIEKVACRSHDGLKRETHFASRET